MMPHLLRLPSVMRWALVVQLLWGHAWPCKSPVTCALKLHPKTHQLTKLEFSGIIIQSGVIDLRRMGDIVHVMSLLESDCSSGSLAI